MGDEVLSLLLWVVSGTGMVDCFVERRPARSWSRWPLIIAMEFGAYFRTCADVRLGQEVRWPASIASHHVESVGESRQAW